MEAISGTRRQMRELADGTIRVQIDIDPSCKKQFQSMFGEIDMPVALAPLVAQFEQTKPVAAQNEPDVGNNKYRILACQLCKNEAFLNFVGAVNEQEARAYILSLCDVSSRKELDTDVAASYIFEKLRKDFRAFVEGRH